jgi:flavin reductase (DIM6/NTAB) family NADH-FMN oxidoreductase RutF
MSDQTEINNVIKLADRQIWIVTAAIDANQRGGLVATWVTSNSIDNERPSMMIAIASNHHTATLIDGSRAFALHLLRESQIDTAWNFAIGSGRDRDKLANVDFATGSTASPILKSCAAWLECQVTARLVAADRTYYWADVVDGKEADSTDSPLLMESSLIRLADAQQLAALKKNLTDDVAMQRPLIERWREDLPQHLRP